MAADGRASELPAGATAAAASQPIPSMTARLVLQTLQEIGHDSYAEVMRQAGLGKLLGNLPPADLSPSPITQRDLSHVFGTFYGLFGEPLARLFLRNYGTRFAPQLLLLPAGQEIIQAAANLPPSRKLQAAIRQLRETVSRIWAPIELQEDHAAYTLEVVHCMVCAEIRGATAPVCAGSEAIFSALLRAATGSRVSVVEGRCAAQGANRCAFRVPK